MYSGRLIFFSSHGAPSIRCAYNVITDLSDILFAEEFRLKKVLDDIELYYVQNAKNLNLRKIPNTADSSGDEDT